MKTTKTTTQNRLSAFVSRHCTQKGINSVFQPVRVALLVVLTVVASHRPANAAQLEINGNQSVSPNLETSKAFDSPFAQAIALVEDQALTGSKGITTFSHKSVGIYCLAVEPSVKLMNTAPVVSIEWKHSFGVALFAQWDQDNSDCGGGSDMIEIRTYKGDRAGVGSSYQTPVLSDDVAFVLLVP